MGLRLARFLTRWALGAGIVVAVAGCVTSRAPGVRQPFPEHTEPGPAIAAAVAEAGRTGKCVLLVFGANWCGDSRAMMARLASDSKLAPWVRDHLVTVPVDVGPRGGVKWEAEVVQRYGRPFEGRGIPALVVLDGEGRQRTTREENPLKDTDHRRPSKVLRFLRWACEGKG